MQLWRLTATDLAALIRAGQVAETGNGPDFHARTGALKPAA